MTFAQADREVATALETGVVLATWAPSIHNTQPWRWHLESGAVEILAVAERQLKLSDHAGRLLVLSCGAALHHLRVSLAADGWLAGVSRLPDADRPDLLARVEVLGRSPVDPAEGLLRAAILHRRTNRWPIVNRVPASDVTAVVTAVQRQGAWLSVLDPDGVRRLDAVIRAASGYEAHDVRWRREIAAWTDANRAVGLGIPRWAMAQPAASASTGVRSFGSPADAARSARFDDVATFAVLGCAKDEPEGWLRAGEGLSAGWLTATLLGLAVMPITTPAEVDWARADLATVAAGAGSPMLCLRAGLAQGGRLPRPHTPRLPIAELVDPPTGGVGTAILPPGPSPES